MIEVLYHKMNGKLGVKIEKSNYGIDLVMTRNGWQWNSIAIDKNFAELIIDALNSIKDVLK